MGNAVLNVALIFIKLNTPQLVSSFQKVGYLFFLLKTDKEQL
jgi:hypothetical protein